MAHPEETLEQLAAALEVAGVELIQAASPVHAWPDTTAEERAELDAMFERAIQSIQAVARGLHELGLPPVGGVMAPARTGSRP